MFVASCCTSSQPASLQSASWRLQKKPKGTPAPDPPPRPAPVDAPHRAVALEPAAKAHLPHALAAVEALVGLDVGQDVPLGGRLVGWVF